MLGDGGLLDLTQDSPAPAAPKPRRSPRAAAAASPGGIIMLDITSPSPAGKNRRPKRASAGQRRRDPMEGYGEAEAEAEGGEMEMDVRGASGRKRTTTKAVVGASSAATASTSTSASAAAVMMEVVDVSDDDEEEEQDGQMVAGMLVMGGASDGEGEEQEDDDDEEEARLLREDITSVMASAALTAKSKGKGTKPAAAAAGSGRGAFDYDDDDGDSDSAAPPSPPPTKKRKAPKKTAEERAAEKAERVRLKEEAKQEKARAREEAKRQKAAQKAAAKLERAQEVAAGKVLKGEFRGQEIKVVLEQELAESNTGQAIVQALSEAQYKSTALYSPPTQPHLPYPRGMVRWTRSPHDHADEASWREELDFVLVVWGGEEFVAALAEDVAQAQAGGIGGGMSVGGGGGFGVVVQEYAALERKVDAIRRSAGMRPTSRLTVVLEGVHDVIAVLAAQGQGRGEGVKVGTPDLEEALVWLLLHKGVEHKITGSPGETATYVGELTRSLADTPYRDTHAEANCGYQKSKTPLPHDLTVAATTEEAQVARITWLHQLETIPGIGADKAISILRYHPTLPSLLRVYNDPRLPTQHKENYLADKMGGDRLYQKFSRKIYHILTSRNPEQLLADD